jgi:hypothetical protein
VYQYFNIYRQYIFYQDKNGTDIKRINATIFSGFAAKEDGNASIRVELDNNLECKRFCL